MSDRVAFFLFGMVAGVVVFALAFIVLNESVYRWGWQC